MLTADALSRLPVEGEESSPVLQTKKERNVMKRFELGIIWRVMTSLKGVNQKEALTNESEWDTIPEFTSSPDQAKLVKPVLVEQKGQKLVN